MVDIGRMPLVSDEVVPAIRKFCFNRNYRCEGCMFSAKEYLDDPPKHMDCIFANMPRDWRMSSEV